MTDPLATPREAYRVQLTEAITEAAIVIESGPREGEKVILFKDLLAVLEKPLGPVSDRSAEIRTPGRVVVSAICPRCGQPASIALDVGAELRVDTMTATLHLKGKSKPVTHTCGQTTLDQAAADQSSFELEDIVGEEPTEPET